MERIFLARAGGKAALQWCTHGCHSEQTGFDPVPSFWGELLLTPGFKAAALVEGWSLHSCQQHFSLNIISAHRVLKDLVVGLCVYRWSHVGLVLVCAEIHQQQCSPLSLFLHVCSMCSSHISANIYTGCKTLLISFPCLLSCSFSHWPFFMLTESDSGDGEGVRAVGGGGGGQVSVTVGQEREALVRGEGQRPEERRAEESAFIVMDGLSSSRNQKLNLPRHLLAKARSAAMQGVNCAVIWHLLTSKNMLLAGRERGVVMIPAWFLNEPNVSEKRRKTRVQLQDEVSHLWSLSSAQQLDQWGLCNYIWWCAAQINELCAGWPIAFAPHSLDKLFTCSMG